MSEHVHFDEAALLEVVLQRSPTARGAEVRACATCARRARELEAFVGRCRDAFATEPAALARESAALAQRVLARTTREDLGVGGDLALLRGFLRERWRASRALRIAAASLLVHLAALPLLAYYGYFARREPYVLRFEMPARPAPFEGEPEPTLPVELPDSGALQGLEPELITVDETQNALRWARFHLGTGGAPPEREPATRAGELLAARSRLLAGRSVEPLEAPGPSAGRLERALFCEWMLDRHVLGLGDAGELDAALRQLLGDAGAEDDATELAWIAALGRAAGYGLFGERELALLAERVERLAGTPRGDLARALGFDRLRRGAPLDAAWLAALRAALEGGFDGDAAVEAWRNWGQ